MRMGGMEGPVAAASLCSQLVKLLIQLNSSVATNSKGERTCRERTGAAMINVIRSHFDFFFFFNW